MSATRWLTVTNLKRFCSAQVMIAYGSDVPFMLAATKFLAANNSTYIPIENIRKQKYNRTNPRRKSIFHF